MNQDLELTLKCGSRKSGQLLLCVLCFIQHIFSYSPPSVTCWLHALQITQGIRRRSVAIRSVCVALIPLIGLANYRIYVTHCDAFTCNPPAVKCLLTSSYFRTHGQLLTFDPWWWVPIGQCPARHQGWEYIYIFWGNNNRDFFSPWPIEYRPLDL